MAVRNRNNNVTNNTPRGNLSTTGGGSRTGEKNPSSIKTPINKQKAKQAAGYRKTTRRRNPNVAPLTGQTSAEAATNERRFDGTNYNSEVENPNTPVPPIQIDPTQPPYYNQFQEPNFTPIESVDSAFIPKKFGRPEDYIELHIYDKNNNLLLSDENFLDYELGGGDDIEGDLSNELNINIEAVLKQNGFLYGQYNVVFNIQRRKIFNTLDKIFCVKEISPNRREIRATVPESNNTAVERYIKAFGTELRATPFFKDFVINFGEDQMFSCINIQLDKAPFKYEVLIKTLEGIPNSITTQTFFRVAEDIVDKLSIPIDLGEPRAVKYGTPLQGPNFRIDTRINSSIPSEFKNYNSLLNSKISGSYLRLINELNKKEIPSIKYDYVRPVSKSNDEEEEETYHFENFIHFGSAVERIKNFVYKIKLLELYDGQVQNLNSITGTTAMTTIVLNSKSDIAEKKQKILQNLDGYEKFLYYNSGSLYSWPKNSQTLISGAYSLYPVTSSQIKDWLGGENRILDNYGGQLKSASLFDEQNPHNLEKIIPNFVIEDPDQSNYKLFYHMIGQHFDHLWTHIKHITEQKNTHHVRGVSKDLVYHSLKSIGIDAFDQFENSNLIEYILGQSVSGSSYMTSTYSGSESFVTASNEGSLPKNDIAKNVWKRLYHNAPYLLKTKGTERGIRALMSCYGVPSTILNIKEYGGSSQDKTGFKTFTYDKSSLALHGLSKDQQYFIKTPWSSSNTQPLSSSAKTVTFRIQPTRPSDDVDYHLFSLSGSQTYVTHDPILILNPYTGPDISSSNDASTYGRLSLAFNGSVQASTAYFPVYNKDFWNIFIGTPATSGSSANITFGAFKSNFNKNVFNYTASVSQTEVQRATTFGDPFYGSGSFVNGAEFAYFGGIETNPSSVYDDFDLTYSGSLQEIRYYFHDNSGNQILTMETLKKQALAPFMYAGNSVSSSYNELVLRLPLGSNNQKSTGNFVPNTNIALVNNDTDISGGLSSPIYKQIEEIHFLPTPDTVGISATSEKIRVDTGTVDDDLLSPVIKSETSILDRQAPDYEDLGIFLSPTNEINEDIIYTLGAFRLDDFIGSPLPDAQRSSSYADLETIKDIYFKKVTGRFNYWDYIKHIQYIDHTLFKLIEKFVPAKANLKTGLLIEPHFLERNKFAREIPEINDDQTTIPGSYNTIEFSINGALDGSDRKFSLQGSEVITSNNEIRTVGRPFFSDIGRFIVGTSRVNQSFTIAPTRKETGTNATIDIGPEGVLKQPTPNTTFNTQFCQAPIKPYTGIQPENYKAYTSNILLGNATKTKKSSIYYRSLDKGKEFDY